MAQRPDVFNQTAFQEALQRQGCPESFVQSVTSDFRLFVPVILRELGEAQILALVERARESLQLAPQTAAWKVAARYIAGWATEEVERYRAAKAGATQASGQPSPDMATSGAVAALSGDDEDAARRLVTWAYWQLTAGLLRRHHRQSRLRVFETHPCDGMYDCLSIYARANHVLDLNRVGSIHLWEPFAAPRTAALGPLWRELGGSDTVPRLSLPASAYLACPDQHDFLHQLEDAIGLPSTRGQRPPPTTRPVLSFRLLAALAKRLLRGAERLDIRNAWFDSSGEVGMIIRPELRRFPAQDAAIAASEGEDLIKEAAKFWLLTVSATMWWQAHLDSGHQVRRRARTPRRSRHIPAHHRHPAPDLAGAVRPCSLHPSDSIGGQSRSNAPLGVAPGRLARSAV